MWLIIDVDCMYFVVLGNYLIFEIVGGFASLNLS
jgi:hypothetical protein